MTILGARALLVLRAVPGWSADPTYGRSSARCGRSGNPIPRSLAYWGDYPEEVDAFIDRARAEAAQARAGWERQQELLGR